jgi:hypothetical protein
MRITLVVVAVLAGLPAGARASPGTMDWQRKVVTCTGAGAPNLRDAGGNVAAARIGAEKAAKLDALRSCMETLKGVQLQTGQTVGGALESNATLSGKVEGIVRGFRVVGKPRYFSDGGVEMDVEVPLEGALSDALLPRPDPKPPAAAGTPSGTSLVVDARGLAVVPALAPRILVEGGAELYGPASLADAGRRGGVAAYARDLESAKVSLAERLGTNPLVVKAVRAQGADLFVSPADAAALAGRNLAFLSEGRVIILGGQDPEKRP